MGWGISSLDQWVGLWAKMFLKRRTKGQNFKICCFPSSAQMRPCLQLRTHWRALDPPSLDPPLLHKRHDSSRVAYRRINLQPSRRSHLAHTPSPLLAGRSSRTDPFRPEITPSEASYISPQAPSTQTRVRRWETDTTCSDNGNCSDANFSVSF